MQAIRKQIHLALLNVSRLCEEFARKYPQYYPPPPISHEGYSQLPYSNFPPVQSPFPIIHPNPWNSSDGQCSMTQAIHFTKIKKEKDQKQRQKKISKTMETQEGYKKKAAKEIKKQQKKLDQLKREQQRQKMKLQALKGKKKIKNTLKNQIKRDPRLAEKPKFPMSPYFLFLKEMRSNNIEKNNSLQTSKQFAQQMGKAWREMSEQRKTPYITAYLKQKRIFDEKNIQFYEKYPDLKPRSITKKSEHMYSVNDPKYQSETQAFDDQQLQADLIDELNSQEDGHEQVKQNLQIKDVENGLQSESPKRKDSLTLSDERLTSQALNGNSPSEAVEID